MANDRTQPSDLIMDMIYIDGLVASTTIGVYEHERTIKQQLIIDLELSCNTRAAGVSDNVEDALDYDAISRQTIAFVESKNYYLIEAVAENLATFLFREFPVLKLRIKIDKPGAVDVAVNVGVVIERNQPNSES
jgi:dihydroneopterin aldolase